MRTSGGLERPGVSRALYEDVHVGDNVRLWKFRGGTVAVSHDSTWSATRGVPKFPVAAAVLGTLLLAAPAVAAAVWVRVRVNPPDDLPAFDIILVAGSAVVAVGLVLGGWIADQYTSFDPRYIYISLALTPVAALLTALRAMLRRRAVGR